MGERVPAWIDFAPWDEDKVRASEHGRALLKAIEDYGFSDREVVDQAGVAVLSCQDYEANYGTAAFEAVGFAALAGQAGLWCADGDEGGPDWDRNHAVHTPSGPRGWWAGSATHETVISESTFQHLVARKTPEGALDSIRRYFAEGNRSLGEWVAGASDAAEAQRP